MAITELFLSKNQQSLFGAKSLRQRLEHELDPERLARILKVDESARDAGQNNQPPTEALEPDANEQRIAQHFIALRAQIAQEVGAAFAALMSRCDELQESFGAACLNVIVEQAAEVLDRHRARSRAVLSEASRLAGEAKRKLDAFCNANHLTHEPRAASPGWLILLGAGAAISWEGFVNAWAFSIGSPNGWRGGLIQALIFSSVNVVTGLAGGIAARNLFHRRPAIKALGVLTTMLYIVFLVPYTLLGAHFRDALLMSPEDATTDAVLLLIENPFAINDVNTLLLVICSTIFAITAFSAGLLAADPYPRFSRLHNHWVMCHSKLLAARCNYLGGIDALTEPMLTVVTVRLREARLEREHFAKFVCTAQQLSEDYLYCERRIASTYTSLIQRVRSINLQVRDMPAPAYFAHELVLDSQATPLDLARLSENQSLARRFPQHAQDLATLADTVQGRIRELRRQARAGADDYFAAAEKPAERRREPPADVQEPTAEPSAFADSPDGGRMPAETPPEVRLAAVH
ncbi:MAG: hypothetical protein ACRER2_01915 [Methylococcales bacterium]